MPRDHLNPFDLLELEPVQQDIVSHVVRHGPTDVTELAGALGLAVEEAEQAVSALEDAGQVARSGRLVRPRFGRAGRARALPTRLWDMVLTTNRAYSAVDIAVLRAAMPMLQFARARMGEFADHGPGHALRVRSFATQLGAVVGLSREEQHLLRMAAMFHDVGNAVNRDEHHIISARAVERLVESGELPVSAEEGTVVALLCRWHRERPERDRHDIVRGNVIRTALLADILRVADAMDIDFRRVDHPEHLRRVVEFFFPGELPFWTSLETILGVRVICGDDVHLQVFVRPDETPDENMQIAMLRRDLSATALGWRIQVAQVGVPPSSPRTGARALIIFPFEPHSIVMAAISRKHLEQAGYEVDLQCHAGHGEASLPGTPPAFGGYDQIVFIGQSSADAIIRPTGQPIEAWQGLGGRITWLSRHEVALDLVAELRSRGVALGLGSDWAYFWGQNVDPADLAWARIAAACTRDPGQATVPVEGADGDVMRGLLAAVYTAARASEQPGNWTERARPLVARIEADDRLYFRTQAGGFSPYLAPPGRASRVGRTLLFQSDEPSLPPSIYWALEAAIEGSGRTRERGISFHAPYAIAVAGDEETAEVMAINHWQDDRAIPVRLLYPSDPAPAPAGNEAAIRVVIPGHELEDFLARLLAAFNGV